MRISKKRVSNTDDVCRELWEQFRKCVTYHDALLINDNTERAYRFYEGDQWHGIDDETLPMYNFIKPTVDYKVAMTAMNTMTINYSTPGVAAERTESVLRALNLFALRNWERLKMDSKCWEVIRAAAIAGDAYIYFYDGKLHSQLINNTDIFFADEQYLVWNRTFGVEEKVYVKLPEKFLLNSGVMQIKLNAGDAAKGKSIVGKECCFYTDESYYSPISTATIEKYTDTLPNAYEISDDSIPESLQPVSMDNVNLLCIAANGCAEYEQSFIRHWLNLPKEGGNWESGGMFALPKADGKYIPQTIKGLQSILPDDFLSVVQPAAVECVEPPVYISHQANAQYTLKDKFFLLSDAQVYGSQTHSKSHEGEQLEYYKSLDNTGRIEYATDGGAVHVFLRTPRNTTSLDSIGCNVCTTARTSGRSESYPARSQNVYFAPVCIIA